MWPGKPRPPGHERLGRFDYLLRAPWRYPPLRWGSRFGRRFEPGLFYGALSEEALFRWCIEGKWKLVLTYDGEVNRYASTHPRTEKGPQLFDLLSDPHEKANVAKDHPEVVVKLAKQIADWYPVKGRKTQTKSE